jgi:hypothetical protein
MGISDVVARVVQLEEGPLESEEIRITAVEAIEYLSGTLDTKEYYEDAGLGDGPASLAEPEDYSLDALSVLDVKEAPYALVGAEDIRALTLAGRETLSEVGYVVYLSLDGSADYVFIDTVSHYSPRGTLVAEYTVDTYAIDDETGFQVDFDNGDVALIDSISRASNLLGYNLAMLGDEIISFETITPVSGDRYELSGIIRGMFDTEQETHSAGEVFWFLGGGYYGLVDSSQFLKESTRYFKYVPFSGLYNGALADAAADNVTFAGRAFKPYRPWGFQCNDGGGHGIYSTDCVLTWSPRIRHGAGAGLQNESVPDAAASYEGFFELEMWEPTLAGSKTGSQGSIEAMTYTMTPTLGGDAAFRLRNGITTDGITYYSDWSDITVTYAATTTTTTSTTTTTTA